MGRQSNTALGAGVFLYSLFAFLMGFYINKDESEPQNHAFKAVGIMWAILIIISIALGVFASADPFMLFYIWTGMFNLFGELISFLINQL